MNIACLRHFQFLCARNGPIIIASKLVLRKVRNASAGEHTIGSSLSLNDVLSNTGHPVNLPNSIKSA